MLKPLVLSKGYIYPKQLFPLPNNNKLPINVLFWCPSYRLLLGFCQHLIIIILSYTSLPLKTCFLTAQHSTPPSFSRFLFNHVLIENSKTCCFIFNSIKLKILKWKYNYRDHYIYNILIHLLFFYSEYFC